MQVQHIKCGFDQKSPLMFRCPFAQLDVFIRRAAWASCFSMMGSSVNIATGANGSSGSARSDAVHGRGRDRFVNRICET